MRYPVKLKREKQGGYTVTFPDIPEAITQGETLEESLQQAKDALASAMGFYFEDRRPVPAPSAPKRGQHLVELPASLSAKVLLLNEMLRQGVKPADLARRIGTSRQEVNRLTDLRHSTRIDGVDAALKALGRRLVIDIA